MIKVGINGYGTIGKRVAEAVTLQDDMEIIGIVKTKPCLLYTSPSPRDRSLSRMPSSA